jgi:hypothetical protein
MWNYVLPFGTNQDIYSAYVEDLWSVTSRFYYVLRYDYDNLSKEEATKAITTTWRLDLILIIS